MSSAIGDNWVVVFVDKPFHLLLPSIHKFARSPLPMPPPPLPPELWLYIHWLATADLTPDRGATPAQALSDPDMNRYLKAARSLGRVCRSWNQLAHEILYENVWVNEGFASLATALEKPGIGRLVRRLRLSTTRFDRNAAILTKCPQVEVLVQPEFPRSDRLYTNSETKIPHLPQLRELYWIHSSWSSESLQSVLLAAPNLTHIYLSTSTSIGADPQESPTFPAFPNLKSLVMARLSAPYVRAFLRSNLPSLVDLTIGTVYLQRPGLQVPVFHGVRRLTLDENPLATVVHLPTIFARCPNVRELRYDVRSRVAPPDTDIEAKGAAAGLQCVRLSLPVSGVSTWVVEDQCRVLANPVFAGLERVVLEGRWPGVQMGADYRQLCTVLLARGGELQWDWPPGR